MTCRYVYALKCVFLIGLAAVFITSYKRITDLSEWTLLIKYVPFVNNTVLSWLNKQQYTNLGCYNSVQNRIFNTSVTEYRTKLCPNTIADSKHGHTHFSACKLRQVKLSKTPLPVTGLISFPGSGNTWVRHLIQQMTGNIYRNILL